jgi:hypothetical protein
VLAVLREDDPLLSLRMVALLSLVVPAVFAGIGSAVPVDTTSVAIRLAVEVTVEDNTVLFGVSIGAYSRKEVGTVLLLRGPPTVPSHCVEKSSIKPGMVSSTYCLAVRK